MEGQEVQMKRRYYFGRLSKDEREYLETILLEEMDIQSWFSVTYSRLLGAEIILTLQ